MLDPDRGRPLGDGPGFIGCGGAQPVVDGHDLQLRLAARRRCQPAARCRSAVLSAPPDTANTSAS